MSAVVRPRHAAFVTVVVASLVACSGGGEKGGSGPNPPPPTGSAIAALEDATDRLLPGLPAACSSATASALNTLRAKISPNRTATASDVTAVRTAMGACTDNASAADRDAINLALDVVVEALAR